MIEITGMWKNTDNNGNTYYVGYMGNAKVLMFANKYKEQDSHPDAILYLAPKEKKSKDDIQIDLDNQVEM